MATKIKWEMPDFTYLIEPTVKATIKDIGREIEAEAKLTSPVDTGNYRNQIAYDGDRKVIANAEYSASLEYGIQKPVLIKPKTAKALRFTICGKVVFAKYVQQKTRNPNPIMRNAARKIKKSIDSLFYINLTKQMRTI